MIKREYLGVENGLPRFPIQACSAPVRLTAKQSARFLSRGASVTAVTRDPARLADLGVEVLDVRDLRGRVCPGALVVNVRMAGELGSDQYETKVRTAGRLTFFRFTQSIIQSAAALSLR